MKQGKLNLIAAMVAIALGSSASYAQLSEDINADSRDNGSEYVDAIYAVYNIDFDRFAEFNANNYIIANINAFNSVFEFEQDGLFNKIYLNDDVPGSFFAGQFNNARFSAYQSGINNELLLRDIENGPFTPLGELVINNFINLNFSQRGFSNQILILPQPFFGSDNWQRLDLTIAQEGDFFSPFSGDNIVTLNTWIDGDNVIDIFQSGDYNAVRDPMIGYPIFAGFNTDELFSSTESYGNDILIEQVGIGNRAGNETFSGSFWENMRFIVGGSNEFDNGFHGNVITLLQLGNDNIADLEVYGFRNNLSINQGSFSYNSRVRAFMEGDFNTVNVATNGVFNSRVFFDIFNINPVEININNGNFNSINVIQNFTIDNIATVDIFGDDNIVDIRQSSVVLDGVVEADSNTASVSSGGFGIAFGNEVSIEQSGSFNDAVVTIGGFGGGLFNTDNVVDIVQTGRFNTVDLAVSGALLDIDIVQEGDFNAVVGEDFNRSFDVDGVGVSGELELEIRQTGDNNIVMGGLESNLNTLRIVQENGQFARVFTTGAGNSVSITQR